MFTQKELSCFRDVVTSLLSSLPKEENSIQNLLDHLEVLLGGFIQYDRFNERIPKDILHIQNLLNDSDPGIITITRKAVVVSHRLLKFSLLRDQPLIYPLIIQQYDYQDIPQSLQHLFDHLSDLSTVYNEQLELLRHASLLDTNREEETPTQTILSVTSLVSGENRSNNRTTLEPQVVIPHTQVKRSRSAPLKKTSCPIAVCPTIWKTRRCSAPPYLSIKEQYPNLISCYS